MGTLEVGGVTIMEPDWSNPKAEQIRLSLAFLDDFKLPFERRGMSTKFPASKEEAEKLADEMAKVVRDTLLFMINTEMEAQN